MQEIKDLKAAAKFLGPIPDTSIIKRLSRITAKTLVVTSSNDRFIPATYGEVWRKQIKGAESKTILDAGHLVSLEQPNRLATVAGSWFIRV